MNAPVCPTERRNLTLITIDGIKGMLEEARPLDIGVPLSKHQHWATSGAFLGTFDYCGGVNQLLVTAAPLKYGATHAFSLRRRSNLWWANPLIVIGADFVGMQIVEIEKTAWLEAAWHLALGFCSNRNGSWQHDREQWTIVCAWPDWEEKRLSWPQRAEDLGRRLNQQPLQDNTLTKKCHRGGLFPLTTKRHGVRDEGKFQTQSLPVRPLNV